MERTTARQRKPGGGGEGPGPTENTREGTSSAGKRVEHAPSSSSHEATGGARPKQSPGAIIGAGLAGSAAMLSLLVCLGVWILAKLSAVPAPQTHMHDSSTPASWPVHLLTQTLASFSTTLARRLVPATQVVAEDAFSYALTAMLYAACKHKVADALGNRGVSVGDLSRDTQTSQENLFRLMRALSQHGYFQCDGGGGWWNTHLSSVLRGDHPNNLCPLIVQSTEDLWAAWELLPAAIVDDKFDPFAAAHDGQSLWQYLDSNTERRELFARAMTAADGTGWYGEVHDYPWTKHTRVIDVGGSLGTLLWRLLAAHAHKKPLSGVLFEKPGVVSQAEAEWKRRAHSPAPAADRDLIKHVTFVAGDFFVASSIPPGRKGDVYVMRMVLHDWSDDEAVRILNNIRTAMGGLGASLALVEQVVIEPVDPERMRGLLDLTMRVATQTGRERTETEWRALLRQAGFDVTRIYPTRGLKSVIEAKPRKTSSAARASA